MGHGPGTKALFVTDEAAGEPVRLPGVVVVDAGLVGVGGVAVCLDLLGGAETVGVVERKFL